MTRDEALALGPSHGAKRSKITPPPIHAPAAALGHLGLHGWADKRFGGDMAAAQKRLQQNGLARLDPAPWNGAWPKYRPVTGQE
ncbi:MAG: hypothetical protein L6R45_10285 [Anaerolineae bacterium]|nr:hypothetical protein [Anaerolineae bacterium]